MQRDRSRYFKILRILVRVHIDITDITYIIDITNIIDIAIIIDITNIIDIAIIIDIMNWVRATKSIDEHVFR